MAMDEPRCTERSESLATLLQSSAKRHNHLCPRQVLGVRMGILAGHLLHLTLPQADKRLLTLVETDGCFADGVAVATGCELGHRTLRLVDYGKPAATFIDTETCQAIRVAIHPESRLLANQYTDSTLSRWRTYLEAYQVMPDDELFVATPVALKFSVEALVSEPGHRVNCAICGEEILNHREVVLNGETVCRACAGHAYYVPSSEPLADDFPALLLGTVL